MSFRRITRIIRRFCLRPWGNLGPTVEDGQRMGEAVLWAEAKLGELLKPLQQEPITESTTGRTLGSKSKLPAGINKRQAYESRQLANNPEEIREVIEEEERATFG